MALWFYMYRQEHYFAQLTGQLSRHDCIRNRRQASSLACTSGLLGEALGERKVVGLLSMFCRAFFSGTSCVV